MGPFREQQPISPGQSGAHASTWVPMGCPETLVMRLPDNHNQAARDALGHRPHTACGSHETMEGVPPYPRERAGRMAVGEGPEAGLLGEPTWAGAINRDSGNRQRSNAEAQPGH